MKKLEDLRDWLILFLLAGIFAAAVVYGIPCKHETESTTLTATK